MGVTTKDLAKVCGVSRATVTRALQGKGSIRPETKQKILEAAKELGYQPDLVARSLVQGSSMTIGVIVVDLKNQYFPIMLDAIEKYLKEYNYLVNITLHENSKEIEEKLLNALIGHRVDGLILAPANEGEAFWKHLESLPVPAVLIGNNLTERVSSVGINEEKATEDAVEFIYKHGYREIVFVVPPISETDQDGNIGHRQRIRGYIRAVSRLRIVPHIIFGQDYTEQALSYQKNAAEKPAYLCSGYAFAVGLITVFSRKGLELRRDFGVMGYDCTGENALGLQELATVDNHVNEIGIRSAELLLQMIRGEKEKQNIEIPYELIKGATL